MSNVYAVLHGEKHEGYHIVGIYSSRVTAIKVMRRIKPISDGEWQVQPTTEIIYQTNGCDFRSVKIFPLDDIDPEI